jgi:predicted dehydrogenase
MMDVPPLRLAIIGCGAVTELGHLPAAVKCSGVTVTLLVDKNIKEARKLADQYNIAAVSDDFAAVIANADAAIVAVPHHLHSLFACELLRQGVAVLIEKPMALSTAECRDMISAAANNGVVLTVGMTRRMVRATRLVRHLLQSGVLGHIRRFDVREGTPYRWPVKSDFFFRKETAGGGVLIDTGAHTLDQVLWWLGSAKEVEYFDDCLGGVEADCKILINLNSGASGTIELSRTRQLRNTAIIEGEKGRLEVRLHDNGIRLTVGDDQFDLSENLKQSFVDLFVSQLDHFVGAVRGLQPPEVSPEDAMAVIDLIERCYAKRRPLELPWISPRVLESI